MSGTPKAYHVKDWVSNSKEDNAEVDELLKSRPNWKRRDARDLLARIRFINRIQAKVIRENVLIQTPDTSKTPLTSTADITGEAIIGGRRYRCEAYCEVEWKEINP